MANRGHVRGAAVAAALTGHGLAARARPAIRAARNPSLLAVAGIGAVLLYVCAGTWLPGSVRSGNGEHPADRRSQPPWGRH
jgi:hypothetical protein